MKSKANDGGRFETGIPNLDALMRGGLPKGSAIVVGGPPGGGKTILVQQLCFHNATPERRVLYFNTLSEPTAKTLRYLAQFSFFDPGKLESAIQFVDLGMILRADGLEEATKLIMDQVKKTKPAIVVIDSFKVFDDLAKSKEELRKFGYELAVSLMAWETTTFLIGEYGAQDFSTNPLFSIIDGLFLVTQRELSGEQQRFIQVLKLRGTDHNRDEHSFVITADGIEVFAPRVTIQREDRGPGKARCKTGISKLDDLLGAGIPRGSSLLVAGVAGTGKTLLLLEFLFRGAQIGEKGMIFSFEETAERLRATALGLGWEFDKELERGMLEIVFIPQPDILVEAHLLMIQRKVQEFQARRVAIDSISVFLHKIKDPQITREKVFQLASIVQNSQAVGFFATDIPYGVDQLSRMGVEETVVDGVILLSSTEEGLTRQRYLEVYKLRNTAHLEGRHTMSIGRGGISIFPRYGRESDPNGPLPPLKMSHRLRTGVPGLDALCGGGFIQRSVTLVSGSAGIGKSTLALQFILEGAERKEPGLYVALEEGPGQLLGTARALDLPLKEAVDKGLVEVLYLSSEHVRGSQFLAILDDKTREQKTRRLVLDGAGHLVREELAFELRQLLFTLVAHFKSRDVTSLFTLESSSLHSTDNVTERGYSPVADNLIMLRYAKGPGELRPTLAVVKTRGSAHDWGTYNLSIGKGGMRIGEREDGQPGAPSHQPFIPAEPAKRSKGGKQTKV